MEPEREVDIIAGFALIGFLTVVLGIPAFVYWCMNHVTITVR